jgi:hypothetical protein
MAARILSIIVALISLAVFANQPIDLNDCRKVRLDLKRITYIKFWNLGADCKWTCANMIDMTWFGGPSVYGTINTGYWEGKFNDMCMPVHSRACIVEPTARPIDYPHVLNILGACLCTTGLEIHKLMRVPKPVWPFDYFRNASCEIDAVAKRFELDDWEVVGYEVLEEHVRCDKPERCWCDAHGRRMCKGHNGPVDNRYEVATP